MNRAVSRFDREAVASIRLPLRGTSGTSGARRKRQSRAAAVSGRTGACGSLPLVSPKQKPRDVRGWSRRLSSGTDASHSGQPSR